LKIAILGTRGIPNNYGGFEQFAEYLSVGLQAKGHEVSVYNSHNHLYQLPDFNGVKIIHKYDPEYKIGTAGQFIYDFNCILDSRSRKFDIILQLGYTSSSVWSFLFPKKAIVITNMDGLEWKRTKFGKYTQAFLKVAEKIAVKKSHYLVADSLGIQTYLRESFNTSSEYIPYGAHLFANPDVSVLNNYQLLPYQYNMLIARLEPENSIEVILDGIVLSNSKNPILVIANQNTHYGQYLVNKYKTNNTIRFLGPIYDIAILNNLRYYSHLYFHGHTVGGTNPSLLEAMASSALIVANKNDFNGAILEDDAYYFTDANDVALVINQLHKKEADALKIRTNLEKIQTLYSWETIIDSYEKLFLKANAK
jgi:glycosyltransferase involved in cell wall biosynthesis